MNDIVTIVIQLTMLFMLLNVDFLSFIKFCLKRSHSCIRNCVMNVIVNDKNGSQYCEGQLCP